MERRLNELARAGRGSLIDLIDRQVEGGGTGSGAGEARTPAAPTVVVYSPALYVDDNGTTRVALSVSFQPVTLATDGQPISIDRYEVWAYETVDEGAPWTLQAVSRSNSMVIRPYQEGSVWAFRVRAIGTTAINPGLYSPGFVVTMAADTTPPPIPSKPTVKVTSGVFQVQWDGLDAGGNPMPPDFSHVEIAAGTSSSPTVLTGRRLRGAGLEVFTGTTYGQTWYFRFYAVDSSGNVSPWSGNASGKAVPLVSIDGLSLEEALIAQQEAAQDAADAAAVARAAATSARADADLSAEQADMLQAAADDAEDAYLTSRVDQDPVMLGIVGLATIVYDTVAPGATDVLWIDTSTSTPYVWDGDEWVAVVDPDFEAALMAVLTAQAAWNEAQAAADVAHIAAAEASVAADQAEAAALDAEAQAQARLEEATAVYTSARGGNKITYTFDEPSASYTGAFGDTWFQHDGTGTVVGYWQWTGGSWAPREVGSQVIANLDVGKLTAGAATIDTLAAQQIAAETAEFLEARADWFAANKIEADWIGAGAIQAVHIGLGQVPAEALAFGIDELSPNPMWIDSARRVLFPPETGMNFVSTPALMQRGQTFVLSIDPGGARTMPLSWAMPCTPGEKFYLRHESQHTGADWTVALGMEFFDVDGISLGVFDVPGSTLDPTDTYTPYEDVLDAPSGAAEVRLLLVTTAGTVGAWTVSATSWRRAMASSGTGGQRLEISPAGVIVRGPNDDGEPDITLGTNGQPSLVFRDETDSPTVSIDSSGSVIARIVSASEGLFYQGYSLNEFLDTAPRGIIVKGQLTTNRTNITTEYGLFEVAFTLGADRMYQFLGQVLTYPSNNPTEMYISIRYTADGTSPTISSPKVLDFELGRVSADTFDTKTYQHMLRAASLGNVEGSQIRLLVTARRGGSTGVLNIEGSYNTNLTVTDVGRTIDQSGTLNTGGGGTSTPYQQYDKTWGPEWRMDYRGDNTPYDFNSGRLYTGRWSSSTQWTKFLIGFPDAMRSAIAGSSMQDIWVDLDNEHAGGPNGILITLGRHTHNSQPGTASWTSDGYEIRLGYGERKWVRLPSAWYAGYADGTNKGVAVYAPTTAVDRYGYFTRSTTGAVRARYRK